jgi:hypothetical protein
MKFLLPALLLFAGSSAIFPDQKNDDDSLNILIDSAFKESEIDTSVISNIFLCADILDKSDYPLKFTGEHISCTDYPVFFPLFENCFSTKEFDQLLLNDPKKNEDIFFNFLEDNMIVFSLNKVYADSSNLPIKIERLSTEVHVDFGDVISTSYFKEGRLVYYRNDYCHKKFNEKRYNFFGYKDEKLNREKVIFKRGNEIIIRERKLEQKQVPEYE